MTMERNKTNTERLLLRQMTAMGCNSLEVGVLNERSRKMLLRSWTPEEVIKALSWLKYMNLNGHHIYLRPQGSIGLILLDDISVSTLQRMEEQGVYPACAIETSELNYQAWIRLSSNPIPPELATAAGEVLATRYGGDPGSKDWRHFGRAVGFTNIKPKHVQEGGRYPFVKLYSTSKRVVEQSEYILQEARELLERKRVAQQMLVNSITTRRRYSNRPATSPETYFAEAVAHIFQTYGKATDPSRADWSAAKKMLLSGYSYEEIVHAMLSNESIQERKKGHVIHYVQAMTLKKLFDFENIK